MATKKQNKSEHGDSHQWTFRYLIKQFRKESDRAAVILTASLIDDAITNLIKAFLIPSPNEKDSLFDEAMSPLANFSSKIIMAHRLGLISSKLTRDIHLIRKIRNSFAHDIYDCSFNNGSVKQRVIQLRKSLTAIDKDFEVNKAYYEKHKLIGSRGEFLWCSAIILFYINQLLKNNNNLKELPEEPGLYIQDNTDNKIKEEKDK